MGWSLGVDSTWDRDIGYGVPAYCDHPDCNEEIDRGLYYVCHSQQAYGGDGCGLYFCDNHNFYPEDDEIEGPCSHFDAGIEAKPDHPLWIWFKLNDKNWAEWRAENPKKVEAMRALPQHQPTEEEMGWLEE